MRNSRKANGHQANHELTPEATRRGVDRHDNVQCNISRPRAVALARSRNTRAILLGGTFGCFARAELSTFPEANTNQVDSRERTLSGVRERCWNENPKTPAQKAQFIFLRGRSARRDSFVCRSTAGGTSVRHPASRLPDDHYFNTPKRWSGKGISQSSLRHILGDLDLPKLPDGFVTHDDSSVRCLRES
jgi:hypothetical protein